MNPQKNFFIGFILLAGVMFLSACSPDEPTSLETPNPQEPTEIRRPTFTYLPAEPPPAWPVAEFSTDFSKVSVPYDDILSGGPQKDGIPAINEPRYVKVVEADSWLKPVEPVVLVRVETEARAYPIQILMWHEIVNDVVNGKPLVISFCPLCNTAIAYERIFNGTTLDFGTTGRLRFSNLIMYDRQTESWWQQATGESIAGHYTGSQLTLYPASIVSWDDFKSAYPNGSVLSRETGYNRNYGSNPYLGYDDVNQTPFLYRGTPTPGQLVPMARVLTLEQNREAVAYPYEILSNTGVINDLVGGERVTVFWTKGTASALDKSKIQDGRDVGAAVAYSSNLDGQSLTFKNIGGEIRDVETNSVWDIFGRSISGELKDSQLKALPAINHFWFSWAAFRPETRIYEP
jgi:hypothetical protein